MKRVIELTEHPVPMVLIPYPSGVLWNVQTGGVACHHRDIEGIAIPLESRDIASALYTLHVGCWGVVVTCDEADALDAIFIACKIPLRVNRDRLHDSEEAWLPVSILPDSLTECSLEGFTAGILTWENCD